MTTNAIAATSAHDHLLQAGWMRLFRHQDDRLAEVKRVYGIDLLVSSRRATVEEYGFLIIPVNLIVHREHEYRETNVVFALGKSVLISLETHPGTLDVASRILLEEVQAGNSHDPASVLFLVLQSLNDTAHATIREISERLDETGASVASAGGGYQMAGRQVGVADIADMVAKLAEAEELVAKTVESQMMIARAVRWLRRIESSRRFGQALPTLVSDIHSLRRYAQFQHGKIRNLQQSLMTMLDLKQNNVIKVFTIVTAVFTPPTLVAAFYGQNFAEMPELFLPWGEWAVIVLTGLSAILPLFYIKKKGWMR
ncbi:MAG TPA: magnesium transporter [Chloroflexus aurantiacus]|jgi:magnesium transporter|uniref:Mg2 transporter protein CorA family protein n=2 Tax=Chloroflexus TaxID=1107 RepID=A9WE45_CHLAA|nr:MULTISPECIES: CorA family divalent cation transporter [Chloroflexus]ABY33705.1 Mg2 transporter protein CorA family protein [Chloroflexus aurantiacus J-10-fl]RMG51031.1 MAG: magnesium transporter [Chloroflexota bacterium]HBW68152.1 magnesium transporter [Chloroflexus aurantiacus]